MKKVDPRDFGLDGVVVPPLPPRPKHARVLTDAADEAWQVHDTLMRFGARDSTAADLAFDIVRRQKKGKV